VWNPAAGRAVDEALLRAAKAGYNAGPGERGAMRLFAVSVVALAVLAVQADVATAAPKRHLMVERTASGTVIQPTRTIIHHEDGSTTVIVIPRQRSYLDTGTEVSVGDRSFKDYMLPPGGDPGRSNWFYGPDVQGFGGYPLQPLYIPGINSATPF
jgi:hypothetical protein